MNDDDALGLGDFAAVTSDLLRQPGLAGNLASGQKRIESLGIEIVKVHLVAVALQPLAGRSRDGVVKAVGIGMRQNERYQHRAPRVLRIVSRRFMNLRETCERVQGLTVSHGVKFTPVETMSPSPAAGLPGSPSERGPLSAPHQQLVACTVLLGVSL